MVLNDSALNNLEITISPNTSEAQRIIIQSLVDKYLLNTKIEESTLGKIIKFK